MIFSFFNIILLCFTLFFNENILASAPISLTNELSTGLLTLRTGFTDSFQDISPFQLSHYGFRFGLLLTTPPGRQAALDNRQYAFLGLSTFYRLAAFLGLFGLLDFFSPWQNFWGDLGRPNVDCFDDVTGYTNLHLMQTKLGRVDTQPHDLPIRANRINNGFKFSRHLVTPIECSGIPSKISPTYWASWSVMRPISAYRAEMMWCLLVPSDGPYKAFHAASFCMSIAAMSLATSLWFPCMCRTPLGSCQGCYNVG